MARTDRLIPNAVVVFEVVTATSAHGDHVDKRLEYQAVPSILRYVVVEQARRELQVFRRGGRHGPVPATAPSTFMHQRRSAQDSPPRGCHADLCHADISGAADPTGARAEARKGAVMDQTPSMARQAVTAIRPRRFNVVEFHRMAELGILGPDERTELIEGRSSRGLPPAARTSGP